MSESNATRTFRTNLLAHGGHIQRFEDKMSPGIPDTNYGNLGVDAWLEGKHIKKLPERDATVIMFGRKGEPRLAHQYNWLTKRQSVGGLACWWIRTPNGWYLFKDKFVWLKTGVPKKVLLEQRNYGSSKAMAEQVIEWMEHQASNSAGHV